MNKYYIPELFLSQVRNIPNLIENLTEKNIFTKNIENQILTPKGLYKIINDEIYKFKIISKESIIIENYYKNFTLIGENIYEKKINIINHIPIENELITITKLKFSMQEKSNHYLVLELINNRIKDIYFLSNKDLKDNDIFFKNDLISFMDSLNV